MPAKPLLQRQLTANPIEHSLNSAAISPDGKYLAYGYDQELHLLSIGTGENRDLPPVDLNEIYEIRWFPDGTRLAFVTWTGQKSAIWSYSIMTGAGRKLREWADDPRVSPDGTLISFDDTDLREIWVMGANGEAPRRILKAEPGDHLYTGEWSPDGRRIVYLAERRKQDGTTEATLETMNAQGKEQTVVLPLPQARGTSSCWLSDGRIVYSQVNSDPQSREGTLWAIDVDPASGRPAGAPRIILSSAGFEFGRLTSTADGKRIAFLRSHPQSDVYVGELGPDGRSLKEPRRLTLDDRSDRPGGWTRDGKAVLFASNRNGTFDLFRQRLTSSSAELVLGGPERETSPLLTPDGAWLLFWQTPARSEMNWEVPSRLMRLPVAGGPPELVVDLGTDRRANVTYGMECAPNGCVLAEVEPKQLAFFALDPKKGRGNQLARIDIVSWQWSSWSLSPDAKSIAILENDGRVRILSLSDGGVRQVPTRDLNMKELYQVAWSRDGRRLFVIGWSGGPDLVLLSVSLTGEAVVLWQALISLESLLPSPDGLHLALEVYTEDSNAWMIEDF